MRKIFSNNIVSCVIFNVSRFIAKLHLNLLEKSIDKKNATSFFRFALCTLRRINEKYYYFFGFWLKSNCSFLFELSWYLLNFLYFPFPHLLQHFFFTHDFQWGLHQPTFLNSSRSVMANSIRDFRIFFLTIVVWHLKFAEV